MKLRFYKSDLQTFYYAKYEENAKIYDENNHFTGDRGPVYGPKRECKGTFSTATGSSNAQPFGNNIQYDYTVHVSGDIDIDESCRIWYKNPITEDPDCVVVKVANARTFTIIAIRKVR